MESTGMKQFPVESASSSMSYGNPSSTLPTSSHFTQSSLQHLRALVVLVLTSASDSLLYLVALVIAAHSAKVITSTSKKESSTMDNDSETTQEQKKEKPLNELLTSSIVDIYIGPESTHWPLHERLLCHHSPFLANIFYNDHDKSNQSGSQTRSSSRKNKSYGFPDEEDHTFTLLVGWLYSRQIPAPKTEKDVGPLLDLYLLAQKLQIERLSTDVVDVTREYYHETSTYPGLRRVQYIYANTDEDNEMREMMVSSVARQLATTEKIPMHWAGALQRNGQLAVDIIRAIQKWHIEERSIPDVRELSVSSTRGRKNKGGFSAVVREGDSIDTEATAVSGSVSLGSNLGVESVTSEDTGHNDDRKDYGSEGFGRSVSERGREVEAQA